MANDHQRLTTSAHPSGAGPRTGALFGLAVLMPMLVWKMDIYSGALEPINEFVLVGNRDNIDRLREVAGKFPQAHSAVVIQRQQQVAFLENGAANSDRLFDQIDTLNLVGNAIKYSLEKGLIRLGASVCAPASAEPSSLPVHRVLCSGER